MSCPAVRLAFTGALIGAVAACGLAAPARAAPAAWSVDKAASRIGFRSSFGGDAVTGAFTRWDAQILFDPKALAGSKVAVSIDPASAATGDRDHDGALPTADWFDTAHFPRASFTASSFKDLGGGRYLALGVLSIRGVAKPLALPFTLSITGDQARMTSQVSINRSAFGVGRGQFASADTVPLEVGVVISLTAKRAR